MSQTYVIRQSFSYCFRLVVPKDLKDRIGKSELRYSLRTGSLKEAKKKSRAIAGFIHQIFDDLRNNNTIEQAEVQNQIKNHVYTVIQQSQPQSLINAPTRRSVPKQTTPSVTLKNIISAWIEENTKAENWTLRTLQDYEYASNLLLNFTGDKPIETISYETMRKYKALLMKLPKGFSKSAKYKNTPLKKVPALKETDTISITTINKYLGTAKAVFSYAIKNGYIKENVADGLRISQKRRSRQKQRDAFTQDDLIKLFHSEAYITDSHKHSHHFWLPILGLYTGCRIEEICQLYLEDIICEDGIWCLNIHGEDEDRRVKTESSIRKVPLHPLITNNLKFINYVEYLRTNEEIRLFPNLNKVCHRYSHQVSKWFKYYRTKCGIDSPKKVFHSFRHTLSDNLKQQLVEGTIIDEITGHTVQGESLGRYGKKYIVRTLYEKGILKLNYNIDFNHLKNSRFII